MQRFSAGVSSVSTLTSGNTGESEQVVGVAIEASGLVADPSNNLIQVSFPDKLVRC